eukprot:GFKZ01008927.1.p2 GENE.GFKZ01008927.1~~GFKZ01008927.1.p2  ORF type:complete len:248 (+),score=46.29 GFKZ01008927.1:33-746(+)
MPHLYPISILLPFLLLLSPSVTTATYPPAQYDAGPLYTLKYHPHFAARQLSPSNAPRTECPPTDTCRTALRNVTDAMRMLRAKRQEIITQAVEIRSDFNATDLTEPAMKLQDLLQEEMEMREMLMGVREMAIEEGCGGCGMVMMEDVGVIAPGAVVERECGRLERMIAINMSRRRVAGGVESRVRERLMEGADRLERNPERKQMLEERLEEAERDVERASRIIRSLMRRRMALGCME